MNYKKLILFCLIFFLFVFMFSFTYSFSMLDKKVIEDHVTPNPLASNFEDHIHPHINDDLDNDIHINPNLKKKELKPSLKDKIKKEHLDFFKKILNRKPKENKLKLENDLRFLPESIISREEYISKLKSSSNSKETYNQSQSSVENLMGTCPTTGSIKIPVLLVDFPDKPHTLSKDIFEDVFNSQVYLNHEGISVSRYYNMQSYDSLDLDFDIYDWQTLNNNHSYYNQNNATQFELIIDTINDFDPQIDFTQYDNDDNGRLDGIVIIRAGTNTASQIPDQARILKEYYDNPVDGKYLGNTAIVSEKVYNNLCLNYQDDYDYPDDCRTTTVVNTHEFGHILGLPDLYPIHPDTHATLTMGVDYWGMGPLSMMSTDLLPQKPVNLDIWSRFFLGWVEPTYRGTFSGYYEQFEDLCSSSIVDLRCVNYHSDSVIVSNEQYLDSREFFIMSNRYIDYCEDDPDPYNLDNGLGEDDLVYCGPDYNSDNLGVEIYHIDEEYIEDNYLNNSVMYDPDWNYWDDNGGHPGIVFERQYITGGEVINFIDFYSKTYLVFDNGYEIIRNTFDKNVGPEHFPSPVNSNYGMSTSKSYSGVENTRIFVQALDDRTYNMHTKVEWQKCYADEANCSALDVSKYCPMLD